MRISKQALWLLIGTVDATSSHTRNIIPRSDGKVLRDLPQHSKEEQNLTAGRKLLSIGSDGSDGPVVIIHEDDDYLYGPGTCDMDPAREGGDAVDTGSCGSPDAVAIGGQGGWGGHVEIELSGSHELHLKGDVCNPYAGMGGDATATGKNANGCTNACGTAGGNAEATGGKGGNGGTLVLEAKSIYMESGKKFKVYPGGSGGDAEAQGGKGGNCDECGMNGGKGGDAKAVAGDGANNRYDPDDHNDVDFPTPGADTDYSIYIITDHFYVGTQTGSCDDEDAGDCTWTGLTELTDEDDIFDLFEVEAWGIGGDAKANSEQTGGKGGNGGDCSDSGDDCGEDGGDGGDGGKAEARAGDGTEGPRIKIKLNGNTERFRFIGRDGGDAEANLVTWRKGGRGGDGGGCPDGGSPGDGGKGGDGGETISEGDSGGSGTPGGDGGNAYADFCDLPGKGGDGGCCGCGCSSRRLRQLTGCTTCDPGDDGADGDLPTKSRLEPGQPGNGKDGYSDGDWGMVGGQCDSPNEYPVCTDDCIDGDDSNWTPYNAHDNQGALDFEDCCA